MNRPRPIPDSSSVGSSRKACAWPGFHAQTLLWLSVHQPGLAAVAEALSRQPETAFVAATTGSTNLLAKVHCRDVDTLYTYLADQLGGIDGIGQVETTPVIRTLKRAATLVPPSPS